MISLEQAQNITLNAQLLNQSNKSVLEVIRAHHHTLWSRCPNYKSKGLERLVKSRKIFEYWSHAAAFLPMEDYKYSLFEKERFKQKELSWFPKDQKVMDYVRDRIRAEGPLQSKDFKHKSHKSEGWFQAKPTKHALEKLFMEGALEISKRDGFQKVYDLTENVIPRTAEKEIPHLNEYAEHLILKGIRAHGPITSAEAGYLRRGDIKKAIVLKVNE